MFKKLALTASVLGAALGTFALAGPAQAVVINIDPGNVGDSFIDRSFDLSDLNGTSADGSTLTVDFVFSPKSLTANAGQISADLRLNWSRSVSFPSLDSGALLDENGNAILAAASSGVLNIFGTSHVFESGYFNPDVVFSGIRFSLWLPDTLGGEVVSASLLLDRGVHNRTFSVGVLQQLPEPATMALFGLGLAGLGVAGLGVAMRRRGQRR